MTIKHILLFIALFWVCGVQASIVQESDTIKKTRKVLDAFLLGEDLEWSVRLVSNFKQQQFRLSNDDSKLIYRPNNPFGVGFGVANQNMVIDVLFNIKAGTEDVTEKFAAEGALVINRNMLGFAIENVHGYQVTSKQTDLQEFRDDISVFSLGLEYIRILSKDNITVRGMKRGIEDQKKSIFSYGLGGFTIIKDLKADGSIIPEEDKPYFNEEAEIYETSSIGGGALAGASAYFNLPSNFFATFYIAQGVGLEHKYLKSESGNYVASNPWVFKTDLFASLGYTREKFYINFTFGTDWYFSDLDYGNDLFLSVTKSKFIVGYNIGNVVKSRKGK